MQCPFCGFHDTRVIDSRLSPEGTSIRRRRECRKCDHRFSTLEEVELLDITVVKRDGRRELYARDKLERGLRKALEKRSYTDTRFHSLVQSVERDIQRTTGSQIRSADIGEIVMRHLRDFDSVAYIRFASVYRSFEDAKTFQSELDRMLKPARRGKKQSTRTTTHRRKR